MTLLGMNDLKSYATPTGWDAGELVKFQLADGTTYEALINDIAAALSILNTGLIAESPYAGLFSTTTEAGLEYRDGTSVTRMDERTEYTPADPRRAPTIGHMLPLRSYDRALGWTFDFLRKARSAQLESDISAALYDVRDNFERQLLRRFFSDAELAIGSAGYDVPFIKGAGTVQFTPPPFNGQTFTTTHSHFERRAAGDHAPALNAAAKSLWEHGIMAPYDGIVPFADVATYTALAKFIRPDRGVQYIQVSSGQSLAVAPIAEPYIGMFETDYGLIRLWATPRVPTNYLAVYRSYGANDPRNPLKVRFSADMGVGAVLMRGENRRTYPLENATILHEFGVGVADRLAAYLVYFAAAGGYTSPTIA
jgi:hypothetical protein